MSIFCNPFLAKTYLVLLSTTLIITTTAAPTNNTNPLLPTFASSNDNKNTDIHCTEARTWIANGFDPRDCTSIINRIFDTEVLEHASHRYEFISPGTATTKTELTKIMTPRKYVHGTCVITVAMLDQFQPRELPGSDLQERYEEADVATFIQLWDAALNVDFECARFREAGWVAIGNQGSIGILIMRSGSAEDMNIPDGPPFAGKATSASSSLITLPEGTG